MSRQGNELLELCGSDDLSFDALQETINLLGPRASSQNPSCFQKACRNNKVTLEIVQLLYNTLPGALQLRNDYGWLPIHHLCCNKDLDDTASLDILRFMLNIDPTLPRELVGCLPIRLAVQNKSTTFCKLLVDAYPESLRIESSDGMLPIHEACLNGNRDDTADTIQCMLELDPEIINAEDSDGWVPIHHAVLGMTKSIEILLQYDPDAASKKTYDGDRRLPLHLACDYDKNVSSVQILYDAYPEAILASDRDGRTPLDLALSKRNQPAIDFLQAQLVYSRQAQDMTTMTTVDENGQLPLHRALRGNAPLGSIKLLVRGNRDARSGAYLGPATVQVADQKGAYPLHIACEFSSTKVAKYLVELAGDALNIVDANKDSPLHYACRGGNFCVMKYLLQANVPSVSERNNDNKLAIHLLLECGENILDRESLVYVETVYQLLLANPEVVQDFMSFEYAAGRVARGRRGRRG